MNKGVFFINDQEVGSFESAEVQFEQEEKEDQVTGIFNRNYSFSADIAESNLRLMSPKTRSMFKMIKCDGKLYL